MQSTLTGPRTNEPQLTPRTALHLLISKPRIFDPDCAAYTKTMGVFISWSGKNTKSYMVAEALRRWLEQVVQGCNPWVSSLDIDAGERWGTELFTQLDKHHVGIICVTKENQAQPWLNFEAGALAKQLKGEKADESRVCPLL